MLKRIMLMFVLAIGITGMGQAGEWVEEEKSMNTLVKEGATIVSTDVTGRADGGVTVYVIYLKSGSTLYRILEWGGDNPKKSKSFRLN